MEATRRLDDDRPPQQPRMNLGDVILYFMLMTILFSVFFRGRLCCRSRNNRRRRQESARTAALAAGTSESIKNMTREERIAYVNNLLIVETLQQQPSSEAETADDIELAVRRSSMVSEGTVSEHQCAICLDKLDSEDMVGKSPNPKCCHVYHQDCIFEWLLVNEHCPECRRDYLSIDGESDEEEQVPNNQPADGVLDATPTV